MAPKRKGKLVETTPRTPVRKNPGGLRPKVLLVAIEPKDTTKVPKTRVRKGRISKPSRDSTTEKKPKRRTKRVKLNLFASKSIEKKNPGAVLTGHGKFSDDIPKRLLKLEDKKQCSLKTTMEMENIEEEIVNRYSALKSLSVKGDAESIRRKDCLMDFMEIQLTELQAIIRKRRITLDLERDTLRSFHMKRFICCKVCARKCTS